MAFHWNPMVAIYFDLYMIMHAWLLQP